MRNGPTGKPLCWLNSRHKSKLARQGKTMSEWKLLHRFGLRQGVTRVLARLGLQHLRKEWDRVYGIRSGLFHGTAQLAEHEIAELANSAITLCGRIILTLAEGDGVTLPSVSDVHFPRAYG